MAIASASGPAGGASVQKRCGVQELSAAKEGAQMVNDVTLIGRLTKDAEAIATNGKAMTKMRIATNSRWKDAGSGENRESSEFHNVIAFGRLAEICATYCNKGRLVYIRGRMRTGTYDDSEGKKRYFTEVVAGNVSLMPGGYHPEEAAEAVPGREAELAAAS